MIRHIVCALTVLSTIIAIGVLPVEASAVSARATAPGATASSDPAPSVTDVAEPLPRDCDGVTPPGEAQPVCCLSGYVYLNGHVTGADVVVQSAQGDAVSLVTRVYSDTETPPYYRLNLSAAPLQASQGETITITASYCGYQRSLSYVVQAGGQQVDVVLANEQADGYAFERQIWGQAAPRQFNEPRGLAVDSAGNVYVVDSGNARVQVFDTYKQVIYHWGRRGNLDGQFVHPIGIAVDGSGNVYVADTGNHRIQKLSRDGQWITSWGWVWERRRAV